MSGVTIIGALLTAHAPLLAVVDEASIKAGRLPDGATLPVLLVRSISTTELLTLRRGTKVQTTERVAVTVRAANYQMQDDILPLVRAACAHKTGTIAGFENVAVLAAGVGPDVSGPADSFEKTQDFRVSFLAAA